MKVLWVIVVILIFLLISFGAWKAERWINWKYDYGNKVENKIENLEKRISKLERLINNG